MVNKKVWPGMTAMLLAFGLALMGCDNGSTSGGSGGISGTTWTGDVNSGSLATLTFASATWTLTDSTQQLDSGTYTMTGSTVNFHSTSGKNRITDFTGKISGNTLTVTMDGTSVDLTKQSGGGGGSISGTKWIGNVNNGSLATLTFASATWTLTASATQLDSGTYTMTGGNTVNFHSTSGKNRITDFTGKISGNTLTVTMDGTPLDLTKQSGGIPSTSGQLTVTGLSTYNGKFAWAFHNVQNADLFCAKATGAEGGEAVQISGGQVKLPVYKAENNKLVSYSGSGTFPMSIIITSTKDIYPRNISSSPNFVARGKESNVTFANGVGTTPFNEGN
jgi:hypothetical protein